MIEEVTVNGTEGAKDNFFALIEFRIADVLVDL
jgi:hypothetical protein